MSETLEVLEKIIKIFEDDVYYILGGHTGLILQGVKLESDKEIDICTTKKDAYKIQELLEKYTIEPVEYKELEHFKAYLGIFNIKGIKIEIMGDPKIKIKSGEWIGLPEENIILTEFNNKSIRVFTLESEYKYYNNSVAKKERNRKIAKKIKEIIG